MTDPSGRMDHANHDGSPPKAEQLRQLRDLIVDTDFSRVVELQKRLDDPALYAEDLSKVLPKAIVYSTARDDTLGKALAPTVEDAIQASVKRDPQPLIDAIFPVMGPAIRKAVADAIGTVVQAFDVKLSDYISLRALRWRIEAVRTGRSIGEVRFAHTLVYRVEQVFLIHKETGLLLQHAAETAAVTADADMVSGMLTAIQDFVRDSFKPGRGESLDTLRVGQMNVWIEQGPRAVLAAAIRGTAPQQLRTTLAEALERIHAEMAGELARFQGDTAPFVAAKRHLERCLIQAERDGARRRGFPFFWLLFLAGFAALTWWGWTLWEKRQRWLDLVEEVRQMDGIVLTEHGRADGRYYMVMLRDPGADDPADMVQASGIAPDEVVLTTRYVFLLDPSLIEARARALLKPPESISLRFDRGVLHARGSAERKWILEAREIAPRIAEVARYDDSEVVDLTMRELEQFRKRIEARLPRFVFNTADIIPEQEGYLEDLAAEVRVLRDQAARLGYDVSIEAVGHTDSTGTEGRNMLLSRERADAVRTVLIEAGMPARKITARGVGSTEPLVIEDTEEGRGMNRRVELELSLEPLSR